jgi:putative hydrolase of the HAD superfamily
VDILKLGLDLDDLLFPNQHRFTAAKLRAMAVIVTALGEYAPYSWEQLERDLWRRFHAIDMQLFAEMGVSSKRTLISWVRTYVSLCGSLGLEPNPEVTKKVGEAAATFSKPEKYDPFRITPAAGSALEELKGSGHNLHLITLGPKRQQNQKIDESGIREFFGDNIIIRQKGTKQKALQRIAGRFPENTVMVGDSLRSDMLPAVQVGVYPIWIPTKAAWQAHHADIDPRRIKRLDSISELPAHIEWLAEMDGPTRNRLISYGPGIDRDTKADKTLL